MKTGPKPKLLLLILFGGLLAYSYAPSSSAKALLSLPASPTLKSQPVEAKLKWKAQLGITPSAHLSPLVANGLIYINFDDRSLSAVDPMDGHIVWTYTANTIGSATTPPVVDGDLLLFGIARMAVERGTPYDDTIIGYIIALDAKTGRERWRFQLTDMQGTGPVQLTTPVTANGTAYFGTSRYDDKGGPHGGIYALDLNSGTQRWKLSLNNFDVAPSPVVANGVLYFIEQPASGSETSYVRALDLQTQQDRWRVPLDKAIYSTAGPIVSDGIVVLVSSLVTPSGHSDVLYVMDAQSGGLRWSYTVPRDKSQSLNADPLLNAVREGPQTSQISAQVMSAAAVSTPTSAPLPPLPPIGDGPFGPEPGIPGLPIVVDGSVLFGAGFDSGEPDATYGGNRIDGYFLALDAHSGKEKWKRSIDGTSMHGDIHAQPTVDDSNVYFTTVIPYEVYALDRMAGRLNWKYNLEGYPAGSPSVANGVVYVRTLDGSLYALFAEQTGEPTADNSSSQAPRPGEVGMPRAGDATNVWLLFGLASFIALVLVTRGISLKNRSRADDT